MKLGIFDHMQKNDKPERSYADMYANHLETLECADQAGMDFYFVAEHHFDLGFSECPSPGAFLGAASQRTKTIRLGPLVYVLPLWNPIRVAEEVALLDNLTQGRLECGFGPGIGPFTFAVYGVPWDEKRKMAWEALRIIKGIGPTSHTVTRVSTLSAKTSSWASRWCSSRIRPCGCRREAQNPLRRQPAWA